MNDTDITYERSNDLLHDARHIIDQAKERAFHSVNVAMLQRNWLLGQRITEEVLKGDVRAEYGAEIVKKLSVELTNLYGKGFNKNNLYTFVQFYKIFPTLSVKSELLTWSHYVLLLSIDDNYTLLPNQC